MFACLVLLTVGSFFVINISFTVKGEEYFCFCVKETPDADEALKYAAEAKTLGGAGYIFDLSGNYYVIASVYEGSDTARAVAEKNGGTTLKISLPTLTFPVKNKANEVASAYKQIQNFLRSLINLSYGYDVGSESSESVRAELLLYEKSIKEQTHPVFSMLTPQNAPDGDGAKIKYYACDLIYTAYKYFC